MNILIVSSYLPFPLFNGGNIRLYNLIKSLSSKHTITLICERRPHQTAIDIEEVAKICEKVITIPRKKQWSLQNILSSVFSADSFLIRGHTLPKMTEKILEELQNKSYDLIHVETFYVYQNLPKTSLPVVLVEHNIEYKVYEKFARRAQFFIKPFLSYDIRKIKRYEENVWKLVTIPVAVSTHEQKIIGGNAALVPNGVDTTKFALKSQGQEKKLKKVLFIGDYSWLQNRDAATFIISEIWPLVQKKYKEVTSNTTLQLWIVGRSIPQSVRSLSNDSSIFYDEHAPKETEKIFSEADILLAPIRVGGGTSYKILESLSVGTPVVTTSLGIEGISVEKDRDILVSDTTDALADHVVSLLTDSKKYDSLAKSGREKIVKTYDWTVIAGQLEQVYNKALQKS